MKNQDFKSVHRNSSKKKGLLGREDKSLEVLGKPPKVFEG